MQRRARRLRANFELPEPIRDIIECVAEFCILQLQLLHRFAAPGDSFPSARHEGTRWSRRLPRIDEFFQVFAVACAVAFESGDVSVSREYARVRHGSSGCGDDVEAFRGAEVVPAGFFADGAEGGFGEETGVVWFGCCALGGSGGLFCGDLFGLRRFFGCEGEAGKGEGRGEFGEEGFKGRIEALEGFVGLRDLCGCLLRGRGVGGWDWRLRE